MRTKYTYLIVITLLILSGALVYDAYNSYVSPYLTASQLTRNSPVYLNKSVQVMGTVVNGSTSWGEDGALVFSLTDGESTLRISYDGATPQNFNQGQQVVVVGKLISAGTVEASQILVKCPSKYEGESRSLLTEPVFVVAVLLGVMAIVYTLWSLLR